MVMMSGVTPNAWPPKALPVRPKPQMTSSKISRMPWRSQISRIRFRYPFGGTRMPNEPAIGSITQAAMVSAPYSSTWRCRSSARSAPVSASPRVNLFSGRAVWRIWLTPGRVGPKLSRLRTMPASDRPPKFTP